MGLREACSTPQIGQLKLIPNATLVSCLGTTCVALSDWCVQESVGAAVFRK